MNTLEKPNYIKGYIFRIRFILIILLILTTTSMNSQESKILLKTDFDGKVTEGSLEKLSREC